MAERNCKKCFHYKACKEVASHSGYSDICYTESQCKHFTPTADVVPRAEVEGLRELNNNLLEAGQEWQKRAKQLEYVLLGVMHSVDKWLDGDELEQDEVNRAATMREKTLRIVENARTEVARVIFEEIEKIAMYGTSPFGLCLMSVGVASFSKLKKKYTEGGAKNEES